MRRIIPLSKVIENVAQDILDFDIIPLIRLSFVGGPLTSHTTLARWAKQMRNFLLFLSQINKTVSSCGFPPSLNTGLRRCTRCKHRSPTGNINSESLRKGKMGYLVSVINLNRALKRKGIVLRPSGGGGDELYQLKGLP